MKHAIDRIVDYSYVDTESGVSSFSLALLTNNNGAVKLLLDMANKKSEFYKKNRQQFETHDWRTTEQKTLPLNTPFDSQFTSKFKDKPAKKNPSQEGAMELESEEQKTTFTLPLIYMYENGYSSDLILEAIEAGADINLLDPASQQNIIMKAILKNDEKLIYGMIEISRVDPSVVDNHGKSPIHYVINSHKNGSYENDRLLRFLA